MEDEVLGMITKCMTAERLECFVSGDAEYQKIQDEIFRLDLAVGQMELSREERLAVDRLLSANNAGNARYSELAYMQGFRDCAALMRELDLLKRGDSQGPEGTIGKGPQK